MKKFALVTHCYASILAHYAKLLRLQLISLERNPPERWQAKVFVVRELNDKATRAVVDEFAKLQPVELVDVPVTRERLLRRAVMRNEVAIKAEADAIWFTDVDYYFGAGAIDAIPYELDPGTLYCPRQVLISATHELGDVVTEKQLRPEQVQHGWFKTRRQRVIIGGCQIASGEHAAACGYNDGTKWVRPLTGEQVAQDPHFRKCNCDRAYRKSFDSSAYLEIPNVFRIRHSTNHNSERAK